MKVGWAAPSNRVDTEELVIVYWLVIVHQTCLVRLPISADRQLLERPLGCSNDKCHKNPCLDPDLKAHGYQTKVVAEAKKKQSNKSLVLRNRLFQVKARRTVEEVGEGA